MRGGRVGGALATILFVLVSGCTSATDESPLGPPRLIPVAPGEWSPVVAPIPHLRAIAPGSDGVAFAAVDPAAHPRAVRIYYWSEGDDTALPIAEIEGHLIGLAMNGEVVHLAYTPEGGVATFWRMNVASGIQSTDPVTPDDRATSSIKIKSRATMVGSKMYLFGGCCQELSVYVYDTVTHAYRRAAELPSGTHHAERVEVAKNGQEVLVYLPPSENEERGLLYNFEPHTARWTELLAVREPLLRGAFPFADADGLWLVHNYAVSKVRLDGTLETKRGGHVVLGADGKYREIWPENSADWRGGLVLADDSGVYRWIPPDEAAWASDRTLSHDDFE